MLNSAQTAAKMQEMSGPLDRLPPAELRFFERLFKKIRGHLSEPARPANAKFTSDELLCLFPELKAQLFEAASNPNRPSNRVLQLGSLSFTNVNGSSGKG